MSDLDAIRQIEKKLKLDLKENGHPGFTLNRIGQVISFNAVRQQLRDISPLKELKNLTRLHLGWNKIDDILALKDLTKLKNVTLFENPISELPPEISDFNMEIQWANSHKLFTQR